MSNYTLLPTRNISKFVWNHSLSKKPGSTNLHDTLGSEDATSSGAWRHWLMILLLLPIFYYFYSTRSNYPETAPVDLEPRIDLKDDLPETKNKCIPHLSASRIQVENYTTLALSTNQTSFPPRTLPPDASQVKHNVDVITQNVDVVTHNVDVVTQTSHSIKPSPRVKWRSRKVSDTSSFCKIRFSELGKFNVNLTKIRIEDIENENLFPEVRSGGHYSPPDCSSRDKVIIIIPYRNREQNLATFLLNIHRFLMKQKIEYRIFVIEQMGVEPFNKGRLFNAGFTKTQKMLSWKCLIFHDVDLIPLDERILYTCPTFPRHMCATVLGMEKENGIKGRMGEGKFILTILRKMFCYSTTYHTIFGGVTSMTTEQYRSVNGYSNIYWDGDGQDNDMLRRLRATGLPILRCNKTIAQYLSLPHPRQLINNYRSTILKSTTAVVREPYQGMKTLDYRVVSSSLHHLYTHILVDVNPYRKNITALTKRWIKHYRQFARNPHFKNYD